MGAIKGCPIFDMSFVRIVRGTAIPSMSDAGLFMSREGSLDQRLAARWSGSRLNQS
jgi:hypothetical protein